MAYLETAGLRAAVLELAPEDFQVVFGLVTLGNHRYIQALSREALPELVPLRRFETLKPRRVWVQRSSENGVMIAVGEARIKIDRLWHSFGVTEPFSEAETEFTLTNQSAPRIRVAYLSSSCTCTTAELANGKPLSKNESDSLVVRTKTADNTNYRQTVTLRLMEMAGGNHREVVFTIFGNQVRTVYAIPAEIDFGRVPRGELPSRSLRLKSGPEDPFQLTSVSCADLPVIATVQMGSAAPQDSETRLEFAVDAGELEPGEYKSVVGISTTSRYRPLIEVPVSFVIPHRVEVVPSVVAFGRCRPDDAQRRIVDLVAADGTSFAAEVIKVPDGCAVEKITSAKRGLSMCVHACFQKNGPVDAPIVLRAYAEGWEERVELPVVAIVGDDH
ncbi:MAG TPA: DUF1573 domain-containing protein [Pirellulales bacterium]|nr:DUF1573 domain-containing protein [Pirellulales bacterium]